MAGILFETVNKKRMIVLGLSKDWHTLTPWIHKDRLMPYFGVRKNISDSGLVAFTYMYLGPFAIVIGKWIGN